MGYRLDTLFEDIDLSFILKNFRNHPFFSGFEDIFYLYDICPKEIEVCKRIETNTEFILISNPFSEPDQFISKQSLFKWYSDLILRHLQLDGRDKISKENILRKLFSINLSQTWESPPREIISFGEKYGFISFFNGDQYFIPLSYALFPLVSLNLHYGSQNLKFAKDYLYFLSQKSEDEINGIFINAQKELLFKKMYTISGIKDERCFDIILRRCGLFGHEIESLAVISMDYEVTRERVRQIENNFWRKFKNRNNNEFLIQLIILEVMKGQGAVIFEQRSLVITILQQLTDSEIERIPLTDLFATNRNYINNISLKKIFENRNTNLLKDEIVSILRLYIPFCVNDIELIAQNILVQKTNTLNQGDRVILALRKIGKPAHYSEIFNTFCQLFPEIETNENSVHAILSRLSGNGVVAWIGIKGTYALTEWGYEVPEKSLFDTVTKIVIDHYLKTGKPISLNKIKIEISEYRKVINKNSLSMAISLNEDIVCISENKYIPRSLLEQEDDLGSDFDHKIDLMLKKFKEKDFGSSDNSN